MRLGIYFGVALAFAMAAYFFEPVHRLVVAQEIGSQIHDLETTRNYSCGHPDLDAAIKLIADERAVIIARMHTENWRLSPDWDKIHEDLKAQLTLLKRELAVVEMCYEWYLRGAPFPEKT